MLFRSDADRIVVTRDPKTEAIKQIQAFGKPAKFSQLMDDGKTLSACSLAGTLGLGKLVAFWDDNGISIDGEVEGWFSDDTPKRFEAYGWHVIPAVDGHDSDAINAAIEAAKADPRPTLICTKTVIGFGSPNKADMESIEARLAADWNDNYLTNQRVENVQVFGWANEKF